MKTDKIIDIVEKLEFAMDVLLAWDDEVADFDDHARRGLYRYIELVRSELVRLAER